ncbi:MAG: SufD family Fe-S cluster assembly protein, partial [Candidatus Alkanophagales archaeon]
MGAERDEELKERARRALGKPPAFGGDIDVSGYVGRLRDVREAQPESEPGFDAAAYRDALLSVGVDPEAKERSGTFIQCDHAVVLAQAAQEGLEVMSSVEALEKYEWLRDYWWRAVPVDMDKFTALAEIEQTHGYFIRAKPGAKVVMPVQSCLLITKDIAQNVHNI